MFLYRSAEGGDPWTNTGVKLRWRYAADGVINTDKVDLAVLAIEMVYVPQGRKGRQRWNEESVDWRRQLRRDALRGAFALKAFFPV